MWKILSSIFWIALGMFVMRTLVVKPHWELVGTNAGHEIAGLVLVGFAWAIVLALVCSKTWVARLNSKLIFAWIIACAFCLGVFATRVLDRNDLDIMDFVVTYGLAALFVVFLVGGIRKFNKYFAAPKTRNALWLVTISILIGLALLFLIFGLMGCAPKEAPREALPEARPGPRPQATGEEQIKQKQILLLPGHEYDQTIISKYDIYLQTVKKPRRDGETKEVFLWSFTRGQPVLEFSWKENPTKE